MADEPRLTLPTGRMLLAIFGATVVCVGLAWGFGLALGWDALIIRSAWQGAVVTGAVMGVTLVLIGPWRERAVADWMNWWIGLLGLRLLITPLGAFLLYSAASLSPEALAISVAVTYLLSMLGETAALAPHVRRQTETARAARGETK